MDLSSFLIPIKFDIITMENTDINELCRTCFKKQEQLSKMREATVRIEHFTTPVLDIIQLISPVEPKNEFADHICSECVDKIKEIFRFKLQCEYANKLYITHLESKQPHINNIESQREEEKYSVCDKIKDEDLTYTGIKDMDTETDSVLNGDCTDLKTEILGDTRDGDNFFQTCEKSGKNKRKRCHTEEFFSCPQCKKEFTSQKFLNKHVNVAHGNLACQLANVFEDDTFACQICRKTFKSKYILQTHEKRHVQKGHFLCTTCGKGFSSKGCLNRHMRIHTGEKRYECRECKKRFISSNNLNLHFRIHTGVKPYLCTVCGKAFSHPTGLTYHVRTHTKERRYKCDMCEKLFTIQCHLDNHRKIHTGERPYACTQCDKAFIKKVDLQRHEIVHSDIKPHACNTCGKEFLRQRHLEFHMMLHSEERPYRCQYCGKGFIRKFYLKEHMHKHHGVKATCDKKTEENRDPSL